MQTLTPAGLIENYNDPQQWNLSNYLTFAGVVLSIAFFAIPIIRAALSQFITDVRLRRRKNEFKFELKDVGLTETEIEDHTRYYVRPSCSAADPTRYQEIKETNDDSTDLFAFVDAFLLDGTSKHLLILGDSGTGKTSFSINYWIWNKSKLIKNRRKISIVYLGGAANAIEKINRISDKRNTDVILDAFDEDKLASRTSTAYRQRLVELIDACSEFATVIITCRTQFFPSDAQIPTSSNRTITVPREAGKPGSYEIQRVFLSPFSDEKVDQYLKKRFPWPWNWKKRRLAKQKTLQISLLSARPMLLAALPAVLKSKKPIEHAHQLYEAMVDNWLVRESAWIKETDKFLAFSEELAVNIHLNSERRGDQTIPQKELVRVAIEKDISLANWEITGRSLLNRDADGNAKFAHRSVMEYLFIKRYWAGDIRCRQVEWTDYMKTFFVEQLKLQKIKPGHYRIDTQLDGFDLSNFDLDKYFRQHFGLSQDANLWIVFEYADCLNATLRGAILPSLEFRKAVLNDVDFSGCTGRSLHFKNSNITAINLSNAEFSCLTLIDTAHEMTRAQNLRVPFVFAYRERKAIDDELLSIENSALDFSYNRSTGLFRLPTDIVQYVQSNTETVDADMFRDVDDQYISSAYTPYDFTLAQKFYVRPDYTNVDPTGESDDLLAGDLFTTVDKFLEEEGDEKYLIILGESGTGKTSFILNYFAENKRKRWLRQSKHLAVIPISSPSALDEISAIRNKSETALFLDGLDEDLGANLDFQGRFVELVKRTSTFKSVVITCRTGFFHSNTEGRASTDLHFLDPLGRPQRALRVYLRPFTSEQIAEYINKRYSGVFINRARRQRAMELAQKAPSIAAQPSLLAYVPDILESSRQIDNLFQLYDIIIKKWVEREAVMGADPRKLLDFAEEIAVYMWIRKISRLTKTQLIELSIPEGFNLAALNLNSRSIFIRDSQGDLGFIHKSIQETLFMKKYLAGDERCRTAELSDFMKEYLAQVQQ